MSACATKELKWGRVEIDHVAIRTDNRGERLSAVPGAADYCQNHSALVWRVGGGVDRVPAVLPDGAAAGIHLRARSGSLFRTASANRDPRGPAARERVPGPAHYISARVDETATRGRPYSGNSGAAGRDRGAAVFHALDHRAAAAGVVRAGASRTDAIPAVRAVECRVDVRAVELDRKSTRLNSSHLGIS